MFKTTNQNAQRRASRSRMFQSDTDRKIRNKQARQNASCAAVLALQQYEDEKTPGTLYRHFDVDGVLLYVGMT